jgi:transcriptional regulator with XRE-family HTH domain
MPTKHRSDPGNGELRAAAAAAQLAVVSPTKRRAALSGGSPELVRITGSAPGTKRPGVVISPEAPLTNAFIAHAIGVARSQPTRWLSNEETPSPQSQARLADLYNVAAQFQMVWAAELLPDWFNSPNAHLAGRKPIDVFQLEGGAPLLRALRADGAGAYA